MTCFCRSLKRAIVSKLLMLLFKKERPWAICSCHSLQKSDSEQIPLSTLWKIWDVSDSLVIRWNHSQKTHNLLEKNPIFLMFLTVFPCFPPFLCPSLFNATSLFFKEWSKRVALVALYKRAMWANRSCRSLKKSYLERFAPIALSKRMIEGIRYFSWEDISFAHSLTKNPWFARKANSKPLFLHILANINFGHPLFDLEFFKITYL